MKLSRSARYIAGFFFLAVAVFLGTLTMRITGPHGPSPTIGRSSSQVPTLRPTKFLQNLEGVQQLEFCADGSRLFIKSQTGRISVYEVGTWRRIRQWKTDLGMFYISSDGKRLLVRGATRQFSLSAPNYTTYRMWDVDSGKLLSTWQTVFSRQAKRSFSFGAVSPDLTRAVINEYEHVPEKPNHFSLQARAVWVVDAANGKPLQRVPANLDGATLLRTEWKDQTLLVVGKDTPLQFFRTRDWKPIQSLPKTTRIEYSPDKKLMAWPVNSRNFAEFLEGNVDKKKPATFVLLNTQTQAKRQIPTNFDYVNSITPTADSLVIHGGRKRGKENWGVDEYIRYPEFVQVRSLDGQQIKTERPGYIQRISSNRKVLMIATGYESTQAEKAATYDVYRAADGRLLCRLDRKVNPLDGEWEEIYTSDRDHMEFSPDGKWCVAAQTNGLLRVWALPPVE